MVSGESETFVSRVRRVRARARRSHWTSSGGCTVRRLVPRGRCGGGGRWESTRYLARGAESDGARAQRARHRGHGACVSLDALRAMAPRPTRLASWARERQRQIPNEPFFVRTCFSSQESLRTCACMSKCRNRQDFARLPLAEEIARIYSNDKPQRRAVIAPVIDTIRVNRADWRMTHDCPCSHVVRFRPTPVAQPVCPPRFNRDGRTA